jgi:hypothetical protein
LPQRSHTCAMTRLQNPEQNVPVHHCGWDRAVAKTRFKGVGAYYALWVFSKGKPQRRKTRLADLLPNL